MVKGNRQEIIAVAEDRAKETAANLVSDTANLSDERTIRIIQEFFDEGKRQKRFLDADRIPFICDDIKEIHKKIDRLTILVYTGVGIFTALSIIFKWVIK